MERISPFGYESVSRNKKELVMKHALYDQLFLYITLYFSLSITSFSYSKHSWAMSLLSQMRQMRFGMDIRPFMVSEKFQTISRVVVAPTKVISEKRMR